MRSNAAALNAALPDVAAADLAYMDGDRTAAAAGYARLLDADPSSPHAWSGLMLVTGKGKSDDLPPELLRAVSDELTRTGDPRPDPVALAAWASA
jgi:hypothetical protein